jgi:hypothetical protein
LDAVEAKSESVFQSVLGFFRLMAAAAENGRKQQDQQRQNIPQKTRRPDRIIAQQRSKTAADLSARLPASLRHRAPAWRSQESITHD